MLAGGGFCTQPLDSVKLVSVSALSAWLAKLTVTDATAALAATGASAPKAQTQPKTTSNHRLPRIAVSCQASDLLRDRIPPKPSRHQC
jgi:hypothetical protein